MTISRRELIKSAGAAAFFSTISGFSNLSFAKINGTDKRFVLIILRGGLDGLAAVAPYGDPDYEEARGQGLAYDDDEIIKLDDFFGISKALRPLASIYKAKQLAVMHAVSLPYRSRSHFDSQNVLENGTAFTSGASGWLNNAMALLGASKTDGIAINKQIPLVLKGNLGVSSWAPKGNNFQLDSIYVNAISKLYANDKILAQPFAAGVDAQKMAEANLSEDDLKAGKDAADAETLTYSAKAAATFLVQADGPKVAVLEATGWDTHITQGKAVGNLSDKLRYLGKAIETLKDELTAGGVWDKTVIAVVSEFGRTVHENGTKGTDHGTGGVAFVMGGKVAGGKVLGKWPGLAKEKLFKERDLMPTTDMRSIFKTILVKHFGADAGAIDSKVFPIPSKNPNVEPDADPVSANVMRPVTLINGLFS